MTETESLGETGSWRRSVFWRAAGILVAVELLVVVLAVGLGGWFALDRTRELATGSIRLRLDALAEELERRVDWSEGLAGIDGILLEDMGLRFPDPVLLVDPAGGIVLTAPVLNENEFPSFPQELIDQLIGGDIALDQGLAWAAAPIYDDAGFFAGGVVIAPLEQSLRRELAPTRRALARAALLSSLLVLALALVLAGIATWALVRPLRRVTDRVEAVGRGEYEARLPVTGAQEFQRLAASVNRMARAVSVSIDRLTTTDRMRRELIANVGHDLRTPLTAITGRLEEAARHLDRDVPEEAARHIGSAREQTRYLIRLVEDLFELSVLDVPDPPLRLEPVPLQELIRDLESTHRALYRQSGVDLDIGPISDLPVIQADGVRLLRLLGNLLSNARRHTPEGGRVTLSTALSNEMSGEWVRVQVTDSGDGIPVQDVERIFERYYRGKDARTRGDHGTGLGLAIARAVATAHGGRLMAENVAGAGACFTLMLPLQRAPLNNAGADPSEGPAPADWPVI